MKLEDIRQPYDTVISLGATCQTVYQLDRLKLRNFVGPLDWVGSLSLTNLIQLIQRDFSSFMEFRNLKILDKNPESNHYRVWDMENNIISIHDFPLDKPLEVSNKVEKLKFNRQIDRFLKQINSGNSILFVRFLGHCDGIAELQSALSQKVKGPFNLLVVNHHDEECLVEEDWGLNNVCSVKIPNDPARWEGPDDWWSEVLKGITLSNTKQ